MAWRDVTVDVLTPLTLRAEVTFINLVGHFIYEYMLNKSNCLWVGAKWKRIMNQTEVLIKVVIAVNCYI